MAVTIKSNFRARRNYGTVEKIAEIPNLIGIQKRSFEEFLQANVPSHERTETGLQGVFKSVFPIHSYNNISTLEFLSYHLEEPNYDIKECIARGYTYERVVHVNVQLSIWVVDEETGARSLRDVKEKTVFFGKIPMMTEKGTFVINGTERVIVSQLHRSPGAFFDHDNGKKHSSGKFLYSGRVSPYRGSWLDFEFDAKDILHVRIDRKLKMPATILLRALGYTTEQLLAYYYNTEHFFMKNGMYFKHVNLDTLEGQTVSVDILDDEGNLIIAKDKRFTRGSLRRLEKAQIKSIPVLLEDLVGKVASSDIYDSETGEIIVDTNSDITEKMVEEMQIRGITDVHVLFIDERVSGPFIRNTLIADKIETTDRAILEIYQRMRPGDPPTEEQAQNLFDNLFFNPDRYDLGPVGRLKLNFKFHREIIEPLEEKMRKLVSKLEKTEGAKAIAEVEEKIAKVQAEIDPWFIATLREEDILEAVRYLVELRNGKGIVDDIDHLGNRRVRTVGELLENQYRIGLYRMERGIKEKMQSSGDMETASPEEMINAKPVDAVIKEYFGSAQLSQFMDQTNPLSEVTHKRRLSALGPGGLTRDRAGFEVRDVHLTHYGRICPIETPEGPNIGLIASLSTFARINQYGFIETPYRRVRNKKVTDEVRYYSALEEQNNVIAQATTPTKGKTITGDLIAARKNGETSLVTADEITLMDVSPNQLVSIGAGLIPFLENDDANRALMGANMQRQAVPLMKTDAPFVGTGIERIIARDSGVTIVSKRAGVVEVADAERIVVRPEPKDGELFVKPDIYKLVKFSRSNQATCINQKPIVSVGDRVEFNEIIADGPSTQRGELALGRNITVAFMPWGGYNFEDSILINERLVNDDIYTSIHIEEFECVARETKLGAEEITVDIPNVGEEALADLDESGIVRIGAEVGPLDILVGKITPKSESTPSPEEKLLRAIFGEKAGDVRDSSLKMPPGARGTVISARVFQREDVLKDTRTKQIEDMEEAKLLKDQNDEIRILREAAYRKLADMFIGKKLGDDLVDDGDTVLLKKGTVLSQANMDKIPKRYWGDIEINDDVDDKTMELLGLVEDEVLEARVAYGSRIEKIRRGDELSPGVIKMVKVYVAIKRKIQVGDKMAGRHGNKGVISRILPEEDMPFLEDGTTVDMLLNPLGVPSRMNVGQVLETHLGWAAKNMGLRIGELLEEAGTEAVIKKTLKAAFSDDYHELIDSLDDKGLRDFAKTTKRGIHIATPVFDSAPEDSIKELLETAGMNATGQSILFDGRTGDMFINDVTVGVMYVLKLHHLVDNKIHARSIGPYSLVTQQPLGGKAQFGGQRLGEMEVWAIEAYGAAFTLQEFLTVKSDDVQGRTRIYESIVKGEFELDPGLPESFNVLIKELHALCLNVELLEDVG